eukprot:6389350-Amphidinium_carterae.1
MSVCTVITYDTSESSSDFLNISRCQSYQEVIRAIQKRFTSIGSPLDRLDGQLAHLVLIKNALFYSFVGPGASEIPYLMVSGSWRSQKCIALQQ